MACKRTATRDINQDNWNDEDEPEDAGTFVKASQEVLEKRVVRAARRRLPRNADGSTKSAFGTFAGFKTSNAPVSSPFSFLAKANTPVGASWSSQTTNNPSSGSPASNGAGKTPENGTDGPIVSFPSMESSASKPSEAKKTEQSNKEEEFTFNKSSEYFAKLKGLNESVTQWIKTHVDSNPFCILTPIFRDYERYFKDIEAKHGNDSLKSTDTDRIVEPPKTTSSLVKNDATAENRDTSGDKTKKSESDGTKSFGSGTGTDWASNKSVFGTPNPNAKSIFATASENTENKPYFGGTLTENNPFLSKITSTTEKKEGAEKTESDTPTSGTISFSQAKSASTFSFGQSSTTGATPSAGFSFGSSKPFFFGSHVIAPQDSESKTENEEKEDEDEPPKPDFKPITEDGAFFEKRCKVFVKKDGNFSDRGIGILFLKSTPNDKTQLIVRADNSLGNLLINTLLTTTIPTKRMNKNTVMLVCLPLPDSESPPTPVLLRVKTSEDADTLLQTLDDNKK